METKRRPKKRVENREDQPRHTYTNELNTLHSEKRNKTGNQCISNKFFDWKFGTVNIRSGKQKDEGAKIYSIAKTINNTKLTFCCIQEVKYRNSGHKVIKLDTGDEYEFHWCGAKKRREAGVGILIKIDKQIEVQNPDYEDPRIMAINLKIYGFCLRVVNACLLYTSPSPRD